jgi:hypothetical protein
MRCRVALCNRLPHQLIPTATRQVLRWICEEEQAQVNCHSARSKGARIS